MLQSESKQTPRSERTIVVDFNQVEYQLKIQDPAYFRSAFDKFRIPYPELFPFGVEQNYQMKDMYFSKRRSIIIRRIKVSIDNKITCYTIRPAFVMPYMTGMVSEVEKPLMLRKFAVPFHRG